MQDAFNKALPKPPTLGKILAQHLQKAIVLAPGQPSTPNPLDGL